MRGAPMSLYICRESALAHYRSATKHAQLVKDAPQSLVLTDALYRACDIGETSLIKLAIKDPDENNPLHIMVPHARMRPQSAIYAGHLCKTPLPINSIWYLSPEISVASPELTFVQMAAVLRLPELIALGMELCGTYRRNAIRPSAFESAKPKTLYDQPQLTTVQKLRDFISTAGRLNGIKEARKALKYVRDYSASPYETIIYLLLCLPRRLGGYALPEPELNPVITFSKRGRKHTVRHSARGDLFWRKAKLDLEYNGGDHEETRAADSMRRKALERMGIEVIELTSDEVNNVKLFHATTLRIANSLDARIRVERDFIDRRDKLRYALFHDPCSTPYMQAAQDETQAEVEFEAEYGFESEHTPCFDSEFYDNELSEPEDSFYGFSDTIYFQSEDNRYESDPDFADDTFQQNDLDGFDDATFDSDDWTLEIPAMPGHSPNERLLIRGLARAQYDTLNFD